MPLTGPGSKPAYTVRGGGVRKDGAAVEEDGSVSGGPGCMPIGRGRSGGVRLRPVSGMRGGGWRRIAQRAGASGALVVVLEAAGCGRRAKVCFFFARCC